MAAEDTVKRGIEIYIYIYTRSVFCNLRISLGFFSAGRVPLKKNRSTKDYDLLHFNKRRDGVYASESTKGFFSRGQFFF